MGRETESITNNRRGRAARPLEMPMEEATGWTNCLWTPGPWRVCNATDVFADDPDSDEPYQIARMNEDLGIDRDSLPYEQMRANARLAATAPTLCTALSYLVKAVEGGFVDEIGEALIDADRALRMARGEQLPPRQPRREAEERNPYRL